MFSYRVTMLLIVFFKRLVKLLELLIAFVQSGFE